MSPRFQFLPRVFELPRELDAGELISRLADPRGFIALDSAAGSPRRWSWVCFDPLPPQPDPARGLVGLRALLAQLERAEGDAIPGPFQGGFVGALAYDLGAAGERAVRVAPEPFGWPNLFGGLYVDFVVRDETLGRAWLVLGEVSIDGRADLRERRERVLARLERPRARQPFRATSAIERCTGPEEHRARIERCRASIAAGDIYQANLAHRFTAQVQGDPLDLYLALRERNPAPYMAFARIDGHRALLCASPELLLEFEPGLARTRPIKGTTPRELDPIRDLESREALLQSQKDLAELVMIVDLERNDLGRIAEPGGVWVEGLPTLQSFASVHHLMADVVARVPRDRDAFDVLAALFPGGSISGCPKLRALELIAELEGEGRGYFCGSLGFVGLDGRACFNVLIRTCAWRGASGGAGEVSFRVGGGITWGSDALQEDQETLHKARGMIDALEAK